MNTLAILASITPPKNLSKILSDPAPLIHLTEKTTLIPGVPDGIAAITCPVIAYWLYATFFHLIDVYQLAEKYRIHPSEEEQRRNKASLSAVLRDVILQHIIQTAIAYAVYLTDPVPTTGYEMYQMWVIKQKLPSFVPGFFVYYGYTYVWPALRVIAAFAIIDTWQFWLHRLMHVNRYLYRRFHSRHHKLYVPFAYGALYNDPVEGFVLDTVGAGIASIVTQLTHRESIFLFTFATMKTVDDHCGYKLPFDLFQIVFPNNSIYHDIHHQNWGIRHNFSQPFFTIWDKMFDTQYKFVNEYKELQEKVTLAKYKEFLASKEKKAWKADTKKDI